MLYISSINDEVMNRPREPEQFFNYHYGWSFAFAASSFLLKEVSLSHTQLSKTTYEMGGEKVHVCMCVFVSAYGIIMRRGRNLVVGLCFLVYGVVSVEAKMVSRCGKKMQG